MYVEQNKVCYGEIFNITLCKKQISHVHSQLNGDRYDAVEPAEIMYCKNEQVLPHQNVRVSFLLHYFEV